MPGLNIGAAGPAKKGSHSAGATSTPPSGAQEKGEYQRRDELRRLAQGADDRALLPAILAFLGPRVDKLRIPSLGRRLDKVEGASDSPAARWSHAVQRRP